MWNKIQRIYIGDHNQVYPTWKPTSSTVAYYPLSDDYNDYSGNGYNLTNNWGTLTTFNWVKCAYYSWSRYVNSSNTSVPVGEVRTISCWSYIPEVPTSDAASLWTWAFNTSYKWRCLALSYNNWGGRCWVSDYIWLWFDSWVSWVWQRNYVVWIVNWTSMKLYLNWVHIDTKTKNYNGMSSTWIVIAWTNGWSFNPRPVFKGYVSRAIVESRERTAEEIADYYNQIKSNYWL
jgi:hypothetical protein